MPLALIIATTSCEIEIITFGSFFVGIMNSCAAFMELLELLVCLKTLTFLMREITFSTKIRSSLLLMVSCPTRSVEACTRNSADGWALMGNHHCWQQEIHGCWRKRQVGKRVQQCAPRTFLQSSASPGTHCLTAATSNPMHMYKL